MTDIEATRCDICDVRLGHDVHCIRSTGRRRKVDTIWRTREDRLRAERRK